MFYTMGEVSEMFDVSTSLIRYWEKQFSVIKPVRNKKGNRLFTPKDVENFKKIYHLVKERGMTLEGAQKALRSGDVSVSRDVELMERLLKVRSLLLEVRQELKADDGEEYFDDEISPEPVVEIEVVEEVKSLPIEPPMPVEEIQSAEESSPEFSNEEDIEAAIEEAIAHQGEYEEIPSSSNLLFEEEDSYEEYESQDVTEQSDSPSKPRRPRSTPDSEDKELFSYYEQKLF